MREVSLKTIISIIRNGINTSQFEEQIEGGTSGSPIINDTGELIGIVSHVSIINSEGHKSYGLIPRPHLALPVWIYNRILNWEW